MIRLGIDLGGTKIEAIAIDGVGQLLLRERIATPGDGYVATLDALSTLVLRIEHELGAPALVGIGMPGAVSRADGLIKNANSVFLNGRPFTRDLGERLARTVRVANDADCFALSEASDGAGADHHVVFGVILGTGVGGGISIGKRVWTGRNAIAGEWGHNSLPRIEDADLPYPACYCGRHGCIETYLSGPAILRDHRLRDRGAADVVGIVEAARRGESVAIETMSRYYRRLAKSLASVINLLDPDVIVLGGGVSNIDEIYDVVPSLLPEFVFSDDVTTPIVRNRHGDSSGVRGAAWLWPSGSGPERPFGVAA